MMYVCNTIGWNKADVHQSKEIFSGFWDIENYCSSSMASLHHFFVRHLIIYEGMEGRCLSEKKGMEMGAT